jgi:hypothetical protein
VTVTAAAPPADAIRALLAQVDEDLVHAQRLLIIAQIAAAQVFVVGGNGDANAKLEQAHERLRRLADIKSGLELLAIRQHHAVVSMQLERRTREHELAGDRLVELKATALGKRDVPAGAGSAFGAALRDASKAQGDDFAAYESAHHAFITEERELAELLERRDRLERDHAEAFYD